MRPTAFIDRDGTINVDQVYGVDVQKLELHPHAREALHLWRDAGWRLVVVTNQSGIARGRFTEAKMHEFHREIEERVGVKLDAWYHCPHLPEQGCSCRKPSPGLLLRAKAEMGIDLSRAYMIGDSRVDVGAGRAIGLPTVLIRRAGSSHTPAGAEAIEADQIVPDLLLAARWTLERERVLQGTK